MKLNKIIPGLGAGLVATFAIVTVQKAFAIVSVANASRTNLSAAPGANSASVGAPTTANPFLVMGTDVTPGQRAIAHYAMAYSTSGAPPIMVWSGTDGAGVASGNFTLGPAIVGDAGYVNSSDLVIVNDGAGNPSRIAFHNNSGAPHSFVLTLMW